MLNSKDNAAFGVNLSSEHDGPFHQLEDALAGESAWEQEFDN